MSPISKGEQHYLLFVLKVKWNKTLQSTWPKVRPVWFGPGPFYKDLDISQTGMEQREGKRVLVGWQGVSPTVELTKGALCGSGGRMLQATAGPRAARPRLGWAGLGTLPQAAL